MHPGAKHPPAITRPTGANEEAQRGFAPRSGGSLRAAPSLKWRHIIMHKLIKDLEQEQMKETVPSFNIGDTVRVHAKIVEGQKERIQVFEGVVFKRQGGGLRETFTVRRLSYGVGVEKTWPIHSPRVDRVEVVRRGVVRRAKLFYLRDRIGKAAKVKEAIFTKAKNA